MYFRNILIAIRHMPIRMMTPNILWKRLSKVYLTVMFSIVFLIMRKLTVGRVGGKLQSSMNPSSSYSLVRSVNETETTTLLDLRDFQWVINNASICDLNNNTARLMVILVHTSRDHFEERMTIRETWGSLSSFKEWSVRVIFLLGKETPLSSKYRQKFGWISQMIRNESDHYGDIVMGNFVDSYRNLSYKHVMGYKWVLEFCENATFVWKVDDDFFIDTLSILEWREKELDSHKEKGIMPVDLYCPAVRNSKPQRGKRMKWYVAQDFWPFDTYPTYCSGWAYGISIDWMRKIYSVSGLTKVLWIDDIFVTGILVHVVHQRLHQLPKIQFTWPYVTFMYDPEVTTFCEKVPRKFGIFVRLLRGSYLEREEKCMWSKIMVDYVITPTPTSQKFRLKFITERSSL